MKSQRAQEAMFLLTALALSKMEPQSRQLLRAAGYTVAEIDEMIAAMREPPVPPVSILSRRRH